MAAIKPTVLSMTGVTLVLYMRNFMPRRNIVFGQALPVIVFFGIGNIIQIAFTSYDLVVVITVAIIVSIFVFFHCVGPGLLAEQSEPMESQIKQMDVNGSQPPMDVLIEL